MTATENKPKSVLFGLVNTGSSGFFLEGTQGTPEAQELTATSCTWIPAEGYMSFEDNGEKYIKEIRYISGQDIILKEEQDKKGIKPNPREDKIIFLKGYLRTENSGATRGLYNYLKNVFWNENAPARPDSAGAMYREIDQNKVPEMLMEDDEAMVRALQITNPLKTKLGSGGYDYNEERIEDLARLFKISAESPGQRLALLANLAKITPAAFVEAVENFDQTYETEVNEAIELEVIVWNKNAAILKDTNEVIKDFGAGSIAKDKKFQLLISFFKSPEGKKTLEDMRVLVDSKKSASIS